MTVVRRRDRRSGRLAAGALAALALTAVVALVAVWLVKPGSGSAQPSPVELTPAATVGYFLGHYVGADGRVRRVDQGGDTVSEGQAYALLMTAATGERSRFLTVWGWTRHHLLLPDGLLAWHWQHGAVSGRQPAADADIGTAAALVMAARKFSDPSLLAAARKMATAVLAHEVGTSREGPTLLAGPWAASPTEYVDPSYLAPAELDQLARAFGHPWGGIASAAAAQLEALTRGGNLPSDWAVVGSDHQVHPAAPPGSPGSPVRFGFDAVRAPVWMATSCNGGLRSSAAALLPALRRGHGEVGLDLGGNPQGGTSDPVGLVPLAAAEWAASQPARAWSDLERAARVNNSHPSYYTTAWIALTTLAFDHLLERCPA